MIDWLVEHVTRFENALRRSCKQQLIKQTFNGHSEAENYNRRSGNRLNTGLPMLTEDDLEQLCWAGFYDKAGKFITGPILPPMRDNPQRQLS